MKAFLFFISAALLLVATSPVAQAQTSLGTQLDPVRFIFAPEVPGPHEAMRIEVQGIGTFLGDATITWQLNGRTTLSGVGERVFSFTAGGIGAQSRVDVIIDSPDKGTIVKSFVFIPSVINMVWEADTTVPPFFAGKALYSAGSRLTVSAFPTVVANGRTISSNNFSFQWTRNGNKVPEQSGLGRSVFSFFGDQLRKQETISVDVYFEDVLVGRGSVTIPAVDPALVFYQRDPLLGVRYDRAISSILSLNAAETTLLAQPYYFSSHSAVNNALAFVWTINGREVTGPDTAEGIITLRRTGAGSGEGRVGVELQNLDNDRFVQQARTALRILFGEQQNSILPSIFGL